MSARFSLRNLRKNRESLICCMQTLPAAVFIENCEIVSMKDTVKEVLKGKSFVEYPTLYVGFRESFNDVLRPLVEEMPDLCTALQSTSTSLDAADVVVEQDAKRRRIGSFSADAEIAEPGEVVGEAPAITADNADSDSVSETGSDCSSDCEAEESKGEFVALLSEFATKDIKELEAIISAAEMETS